MKPKHYETKNNYDVIDFCRDQNLNFNRGNIVKYISRAGKKEDALKDLYKAKDYIEREIKHLESINNNQVTYSEEEGFDIKKYYEYERKSIKGELQ